MKGEPVETSLEDLRRIDLACLKRADALHIFESDFPECLITRNGKVLTCEILEKWTPFFGPRNGLASKKRTQKLCGTLLVGLAFKVNRAQIVEGAMETAPVIEGFDEVEDGLASFAASFEASADRPVPV